MEIIDWIITALIVFVSILGIVLVLMQSSRGGAGGLFGDVSAQNIIGAGARGDFLTRLTAVFIGIFIVGSLVLAYLRYKTQDFSLKPEPLEIEEIVVPPSSETSMPEESASSLEESSIKEPSVEEFQDSVIPENGNSNDNEDTQESPVQ